MAEKPLLSGQKWFLRWVFPIYKYVQLILALSSLVLSSIKLIHLNPQKIDPSWWKFQYSWIWFYKQSWWNCWLKCEGLSIRIQTIVVYQEFWAQLPFLMFDMMVKFFSTGQQCNQMKLSNKLSKVTSLTFAETSPALDICQREFEQYNC